MTNSEIGELLAELNAIGTGVPTSSAVNLLSSLSQDELDLLIFTQN